MPTRTMRSPRRIDFAHPALQPISVSESPPPADSLSWRLWLSCQDLAQEALSTEYIQGIANGTLDPNAYGQYTIQDAAYCHHAQEDYKRLIERAYATREEDLAAFAVARYEGYVTYTREMFTSWHLKDPNALAPGPAAQAYIDVERKLSSVSIYGIIGMIPCDQLWAWLASELQSKANPVNVYSFWITENTGWSGAYRLDNFVDGWRAGNPNKLDERKAQWAYRACMTCELNFFRAATGQPMESLPDFPVSG